ncbi:AMP-binding protein [Clostridium sp. UBA7503]|uniref:AMP-binding protein n=1 Tax=Clostridium sp. UBA7503 TaxID=1946377 RepID=UPI00321749E2
MLLKSILNIKNQYLNKLAIKTASESLTYEELIEKSCNISQNLKEYVDEFNLKSKSPCCGLIFNHGVSGIVAIVACVLSGLTYVPLDSSYPENRLIYMADNSNIKFLITDYEGVNLTKELAGKMKSEPQIIVLEELDYNASKEYTLPIEMSNNPDVYILYTSGSTGKPKAVIQKAESIVHFASEYISNLNITKEDKLTLFSTYGHDAAVIDIFSSLLSGACLYPLDLREPKNFFTLHNWLKENEITVWHSVPSLFRMFWNAYNKVVNLPYLRLVVLGGEAVREHDFILCNEKLNKVKLYNLYGQTESSYSAGNYITEKDDVAFIGIPVKDTHLIVVSKHGVVKKIPDTCFEKKYICSELSKYDVNEGELLICSRFIANGYWKNEEVTKNAFINSPIFGKLYRTGDYVTLCEDGKIIFSGRKDTQIKIRGHRVEIGEIESTILRIKDIVECAVISENIADQTKLIAFVKSNNKYDTADINNVLKKYLPTYMMIFKVVMIDTFPLTVTGKIDRNKLICLTN